MTRAAAIAAARAVVAELDALPAGVMVGRLGDEEVQAALELLGSTG